MEQKRLPKKIQKYIAAYRYLIDAIDEYRDEMIKFKQDLLRDTQKKDLYDRLTNRCREEGRVMFGLMPRQEKRYTAMKLLKHLCRFMESAMLGLAAAVLVLFVRQNPTMAVLMMLFAFTANRFFSKAVDVLQDKVVWKVAENEYIPKEIVWSKAQTTLIPERLRGNVRPLTINQPTDDRIRAMIKCTCGNEHFAVYRHPKEGYMKAVCESCGREIVLFDSHLDMHNADGQAQNYFVNRLQKGLCKKCRSGIHYITLTIISDENRTFFDKNGGEDGADSGYYMFYQMFCAECGLRTGDGQYFWSKKLEEQEENSK